VYDRIDSVDVHASLPNGEVRTFADLHAIPGS
jgi:hypothetical protein